MKVELNFLEKFNLAKICLEVFLAFVRSGYVDLPSGNIGSVGRSSVTGRVHFTHSPMLIIYGTS